MVRIFIIFLLFSLARPVNAEAVDYNSALVNIADSLTSSPQNSEDKLKKLLESWDELTAEQKAKLTFYRAVVQTYKGDYQSSLILLGQAEKLQPDKETLNNIYQHFAANFILLKQYPEAIEFMVTNLSKIEQIDDIETKAGAYVRLANLAYEIGAYQELYEYALTAARLSENNNARQHCFALLYIAVADLKKLNFKNAEDGFDYSLQYCRNNGFPLIGSMSLAGLAEVAMHNEDFTNAKRLLEEALLGYQEFNFESQINNVTALLSQTYLRLGHLSLANDFASKVMALDDSVINIGDKAKAAKVLSQLYLESQQYKLAYDYLESHQHYSELILDDTKAKANAYQMAKFKHQEQAREIQLLNQERQLMQTQKELDQSDKTNSLMLVTMLIGSIFFLSLFLFSSHRQKIRYRKLALTDRLTGVYNRGAGQDFAENEFVQICIREAHFSVVVFDLDCFKNINDTFGHGTGDWVLKRVVSVVQPLIRDSDIFARMGGEEFAIFLPYSEADVALEIAERCRMAISNIDTKYSGHVFDVSASFGVASNTFDDLSLDPLLKRADIALYSSKHSGRNCATLYTVELETQQGDEVTQKPLLFSQ